MDEFHKDKYQVDGKTVRCKECNKAGARARWPEQKLHRAPANPDIQKARFERWVAANPEQRDSKRMEHRYGVTLDAYIAILDAQGHACAICKTTEPGGRGSEWFQNDHDHACCDAKVSCGKCFRGLVCHRCNTYVIPVFEGKRNGKIDELLEDVKAYMDAYAARRAALDA